MTTLVSPSMAAGDAEAGQVKSATCMGCHGLAGNSTIPNFPKLAGQGEAILSSNFSILNLVRETMQ